MSDFDGEDMPKVSVIVPVYNVEKYLRECLDSIVNQTYKNIEVICIDDGSTDSSLEILQEYAQRDDRVVILQQENQGAAVARNYGMSLAKGEYISFLDSDDVFHLQMFEKTVAKADFFDADITIFRAMTFDTNNNVKAVMKDYISKYKLGQIKTFSYIDVPDKIFNSFLIPAWNKLFKKDFIIRNNIMFQDIKRYNDLFFTNTALVMASKIILLDEVLLFYRVGMKSNLQSGKDKTPTEVYKALSELRQFLINMNIYSIVEGSFVKLALDNIFYNLREVNSSESRKVFIEKLRNELFESLGIGQCSFIRDITFLGYLQYRFILIGDNRLVSSSLYALDKMWEYYKLTGFKNTILKIFLKF